MHTRGKGYRGEGVGHEGRRRSARPQHGGDGSERVDGGHGRHSARSLEGAQRSQGLGGRERGRVPRFLAHDNDDDVDGDADAGKCRYVELQECGSELQECGSLFLNKKETDPSWEVWSPNDGANLLAHRLCAGVC